MKIKAVYSHTLASAQTLAAEVEADAIDDIADLPEANIFVYCVKDDVLPEIAAINSLRFPNALHIHTSGSTPANVFPKPMARRYLSDANILKKRSTQLQRSALLHRRKQPPEFEND